jgi:hypothetical protein
VVNGQNFITYDGTTDANTGKALPGGGYLANAQGPAKDVGLNTCRATAIFRSRTSRTSSSRASSATRANWRKADPNNFGVSGYVKGAVQDVNAVAGNVAQGLGYNGLQDAGLAARTRRPWKRRRPGLLSGVFDPSCRRCTARRTSWWSIRPQALAGQSGRSVTDRDVKVFKNIVGDPQRMGRQPAKVPFQARHHRDRSWPQPGGRRPNSCGAAIPRCVAGRARGFPRPPRPRPRARSRLPHQRPQPQASPMKWGRDANGLPVPMGQ